MNMTQFFVANSLPIFLGILVGAAVCYILMALFSPKIKRFQDMSKELTSTKTELTRQREELVKHFSHSAELLDKMAQDFRHLYQHMADNQTSLLNGETTDKQPNLLDLKESEQETPPQLTDLSENEPRVDTQAPENEHTAPDTADTAHEQEEKRN